MVKVADLPSFDMAESLKTEEDIVMYLNMVLEDNDPAELAHALGYINTNTLIRSMVPLMMKLK